MEIKTEKGEDKALMITFIGEKHAFPNLLKDYLWMDGDTEFAAYKIDHPVLTHPQLILKSKSGKPEQILKGALKKMKKDLEAFYKEFK